MSEKPIASEALPHFDLLESLLWEQGRGFFLLDPHLDRLRHSAASLGFEFPTQRLEAALQQFDAQGRHKVRLLLSRGGTVAVESAPATSISGGKVVLASQAIAQNAPLLRHKTTYRKPYSDPLREQQARDPGIVDVILWDEAGYVTESGMANVIVRSGAGLYTPSLQQSFLPGVFRRSLLEQGVARERPIPVTELQESDTVFLVNSVRGWMPLASLGPGIWVIRSDFQYETPAP
jgi:para-aminobenzoate synthetase/4-amino-4-deoxychorismate lyase